tara:strand:+ start:961 stop:1134 length:174 start_codon:yes stop_codon:yes gene_type:complete
MIHTKFKLPDLKKLWYSLTRQQSKLNPKELDAPVKEADIDEELKETFPASDPVAHYK